MDKKNFLFVSLTGLISDIAWQVSKEGHEVRYFIGDKKERDIADGFVAKSKDWEKDKEWADIIVFDDTLGQGEKAQALRKEGKPVIGGTAYGDKLEDDRSFGQEELKKAGVNIIPYAEFESFDNAVDHVTQNPGRYVIKPSGEAQNVKRRLFVGEEEDGQDVIRMLEAYKRAFSDEIKVFQLQRRMIGVEVAVGEFFWDLASGADPKLKVRSGFQIGVRIVVPPFPFDDDETFDSFSKNSAIIFKKPPADEIHIEDVKQINGQWLIAGTSGVILIVIGTGQTMKQAQAQVYSRIKNVLIPNMYYRTDIGDRWEEDSDRLHNWGYLR
jgi:phosphoribosylamine-glycine ligase